MDKGMWTYAEFVSKAMLWFLLESGAGLFILVLVWFNYGTLPFLLAGVVIGAFAIWRIVRWVNRRDDPRVVNPLAPNPDVKS
jgi:hypothetical protein